MTASTVDDLAAELTVRLGAVDGVGSIFPERPTGAAALRLVSGRSPSIGRVRVEEDGVRLVIVARLSTERAVPTRDVIAAAAEAVAEVVGPTPYELRLEVAYID